MGRRRGEEFESGDEVFIENITLSGRVTQGNLLYNCLVPKSITAATHTVEMGKKGKQENVEQDVCTGFPSEKVIQISWRSALEA